MGTASVAPADLKRAVIMEFRADARVIAVKLVKYLAKSKAKITATTSHDHYSIYYKNISQKDPKIKYLFKTKVLTPLKQPLLTLSKSVVMRCCKQQLALDNRVDCFDTV